MTTWLRHGGFAKGLYESRSKSCTIYCHQRVKWNLKKQPEINRKIISQTFINGVLSVVITKLQCARTPQKSMEPLKRTPQRDSQLGFYSHISYFFHQHSFNFGVQSSKPDVSYSAFPFGGTSRCAPCIFNTPGCGGSAARKGGGMRYFVLRYVVLYKYLCLPCMPSCVAKCLSVNVLSLI